MIEYHEICDVKTGCLVGNLTGELAESSDLCRTTLRSATAAWCQRLAYHLGLAQLQGTVRQDLNADELAEFCWNAWEGGHCWSQKTMMCGLISCGVPPLALGTIKK